MRAGWGRWAVVMLAGVALAPALGLAQQPPSPPPPGDSYISGGGLFAPPKPRKAPPSIRIQKAVWPRLDRGAVLCRTEADLRHLAERRRGQASGPVDCQVIRDATPISILRRQGSGMTLVKTSNPAAGGEGWTDAWLPDRPPER